jgi:hypothetical protein
MVTCYLNDAPVDVVEAWVAPHVATEDTSGRMMPSRSAAVTLRLRRWRGGIETPPADMDLLERLALTGEVCALLLCDGPLVCVGRFRVASLSPTMFAVPGAAVVVESIREGNPLGYAHEMDYTVGLVSHGAVYPGLVGLLNDLGTLSAACSELRNAARAAVRAG